MDEGAKECHQGRVDCRKDGKEKAQEPQKTSCEEPSTTQKGSVEENSPNRKLCFMETLNLTISPIKRPAALGSARQDGAAGGDVEQDLDESYQPAMEDMCVVDEVNCSGLEPEQDDAVAKSPDTTKILKSEKKERRESAKEARRKEGSCQGRPVEATSVNSHATEAEQTQGDVPVKSKAPVNLKATDVDLSGTCVDKTNAKASEEKSEKSEPARVVGCVAKSPGVGSKSSTVPKVKPGQDAKQATAVGKPAEVGSSVAPRRTQAGAAAPKSCPASSEKEGEAAGSDPKYRPAGVGVAPPESSGGRRSSASCPAKDKDVDAVSSTISLDSLPQEGLSLPEAIYILTQTSEEANDGCQRSPSGSVAVPRVSSTTGEEAGAPQTLGDLTFTPKKCPASARAQAGHFETPSPLALLHDEDSMMRTLSGLKRIPDAISPLRSPIQASKRSHHHHHSLLAKPGHVKSLERGTVQSSKQSSLEKHVDFFFFSL